MSHTTTVWMMGVLRHNAILDVEDVILEETVTL